MAAALSLNSVSYQAINLNGGITTSVDGQSQARGSDGSFDITRGKTVSFSATRYNGRTLGDLLADASGQPVVYLYLIPPAGGRSGGGKRNSGGETGPGKPGDASVSSVEPATPVPPKLTESELKQKQVEAERERIRKKLGIK
jgi:hypothetical protein